MLLFTLSQKSVTRGPPGLLSSRVMCIFAISSHKYTITLYTPGHLEIIWELFAKKSADILSFRNSFITISRFGTFIWGKDSNYFENIYLIAKMTCFFDSKCVSYFKSQSYRNMLINVKVVHEKTKKKSKDWKSEFFGFAYQPLNSATRRKISQCTLNCMWLKSCHYCILKGT